MSMDIETSTADDLNVKPNRKLLSMKRPSLTVILSTLAVALIIGLSVGLTQNNKNNNLANTRTGNDDMESREKQLADDSDVMLQVKSSSESIADFIFEPNLPPFSKDIISGYPKCSMLMDDIEEAGKYLANVIINQNLLFPPRKYKGGPEPAPLPPGAPPLPDRGESKENVGDSAPSPSSESSYKANNQIEDVDEADIVKSDGTNVFLAYGNDLVWMLTTGYVVKRFSIPRMKDEFPEISFWDYKSSSSPYSSGFPPIKRGYYQAPRQHISGLLLNENKNELVVIVSYRTEHNFVFIDGSMTASHVYSITKDDLILKNSQVHKGRYETSRLIGDDAHIVTVTNINNYPIRNMLNRYSRFPELDNDEYRLAAYKLAARMLPKYAQQLLAELISDDDGYIDKKSCQRFVGLSDMVGGVGADLDRDPTGGQGLLNSFARTVSFKTDIHSPVISGAFLPTHSLDVYVNKDYLVLAGKGWLRDINTFSYIDYTYLLQFQLDESSAKPVSIGQVPGYFLNQFSIDEYQGFLRIATTINAQWGYKDNIWQEISKSKSQITILKPKGGTLKEVAVLTNLGLGERIYSVRFFQDKGFVVTFRRIDPFFTIDLSDPKHPFVAGELKISGFSNYLHLIEDNQFVLTVGQEADEKTGRQTGLQISLFDVRDFANPKQIQKTVIDGWSFSDAQGDHLSFRYFSNTLILPVEIRNPDEGYDGFYIYNVSISNGITAQGKVTHARSQYMMRGCWSSDYIPSRSMVFEGKLMTMKGHTILMSDGLVKPKEIWKLNLDEKREKSYGCLPWFGSWW